MLTLVSIVAVGAAALSQVCEPMWDTAIGDALTNDTVSGFEMYNDGDGTALYSTGSYSQIDGQPANRIARWDGAQWHALGSGLSSQFSNELEVFDGELYVGGYFDSAGGAPGSAKIARWNGAEWSGIGAALEFFTNSLWGLKTWNDGDGDALYIGGNFTDIGGAGGPDFIARWDGTKFSEVGGTIAGAGIPLIVLDIEVFQNELYVAGRFASVGGVPASHIAKWDGKTWSDVGGGITGVQVIDLAVIDDGDGPALYAGGSFSAAGGVPAQRIAKWDGMTWSALGDGFNSTVQSIEGFDDGDGVSVYAAGNFIMSGATVVNHIARWNGEAWEPIGDGADGNVNALFAFDGRLNLGGSFNMVDGLSASGVVQLLGCAATVPADLNGDGVVDGADLAILLTNWGPGGAADLNDDDTVDGADLAILLTNWTS